MKSIRMLAVLALIIAFSSSVVTSAVQRAASGKRVVWIYFYPSDDLAMETRPISQRAARENALALVPVQREVSVVSPARGALDALIEGPSEDEKNRGLRAPYTEGLSISELTIAKGTAKVSLTSQCADCPRWTGDLSVWRFTEAISRTLKQFPNVSRVVICLDGYEDFGNSENQNQKC